LAEDDLVTSPELSPDFVRAQWALQAFDAHPEIDVDAAFWSLGDDDEWTFYIHTTLIYDLSRAQVFVKLLKALDQFPGALPLEDIDLLPARSGLLDALRSTYSFGLDDPFVADPSFHIHVANTSIDGYFVRYLVLYRL
jgi:hypothetical protein